MHNCVCMQNHSMTSNWVTRPIWTINQPAEGKKKQAAKIQRNMRKFVEIERNNHKMKTFKITDNLNWRRDPLHSTAADYIVPPCSNHIRWVFEAIKWLLVHFISIKVNGRHPCIDWLVNTAAPQAHVPMWSLFFSFFSFERLYKQVCCKHFTELTSLYRYQKIVLFFIFIYICFTLRSFRFFDKSTIWTFSLVNFLQFFFLAIFLI